MVPSSAHPRVLALRENSALRDDTAPRLAPGQLHELHADEAGWAAALLFALTQAAPPGRGPSPLLLVRMTPDQPHHPALPCGDALAQAGVDPARLLIVQAACAADLLRAAHEGARCPALGAVVVETWGPLRDYDLVASRRLVLAAESSGVPVMVLRGQAAPRPSAAHTRWQVTPAASPPLPGLSAAPASPAGRLIARLPGPAAITLALLRQRGGPAGATWQLEWNQDHAAFHLARPPAADSPIDSPADSPARPFGTGFGAVMAGTVVSLSALRKGMAADRAA
jgi:protein ImuA